MSSNLTEEVRQIVCLVCEATGRPRPILLDEEIEAALLDSASLTEGQWITIGAKDDEGGRKGGSHVYIDRGRITKGHPSLVGKKIGALKDEPEPQSHRSALHQEKGYGKAVWAKKARKEGINPKDLHQLAAEIKSHDQAYVDDHNALLKDARKASQEKGFTNLANLRQRNAAGKIDATALKGFDDVADQMAKKYPHLLGNPDEASDRLFDLLAHGHRAAMTNDDAYSQAFDHLMGQSQTRAPRKRGKASAVKTDFDFGLNVREQTGTVPGSTPEERSRHADLIALPDDIDGTRCENCLFITEQGHCKKLGRMVEKRWCCDFWERPGTKHIGTGKLTEAIIACEPQVPVPDRRQEGDYDCGAAALRSVLDYFGVPVHPDNEAEMIAELGSSPRDGTSPDKIVALAVRQGLSLHACGPMTTEELRDYLERGMPVISPIQMFWSDDQADDVSAQGDDSGHWVVITGIDARSVCLQDPVYGKVYLQLPEFLESWHDRDAEGREYRRWGVALGKPGE